MHDPLAALLFCGDSHVARTVIVNGKVVVDGGRLLTVDEDEVCEQVNRLSAQMTA
jgi:cytosine/adenosine deaminase-related metal-dependent hydrolase